MSVATRVSGRVSDTHIHTHSHTFTHAYGIHAHRAHAYTHTLPLFSRARCAPLTHARMALVLSLPNPFLPQNASSFSLGTSSPLAKAASVVDEKSMPTPTTSASALCVPPSPPPIGGTSALSWFVDYIIWTHIRPHALAGKLGARAGSLLVSKLCSALVVFSAGFVYQTNSCGAPLLADAVGPSMALVCMCV